MTEQTTFEQFLKIDLRVGTIIETEEFSQAKKPAYILHIDFGTEFGVLKSSAQITNNYTLNDLVGMQVVAVINFPDKQIGPIMSQCLVTGFHQPDGSVTLCTTENTVPNGTRLL